MINFLLIILEQTLLYTPLLLGAYISFSLMKVPDLSIESAYLFGALCARYSLILTTDCPLPVMLGAAITASMLGGLIVGATSSCITIYGNIPHLLSSIITFGLYHGIVQLISSPYVSLSSLDNPLTMAPYIQKHPEFITLAVTCGILLCLFISFSHTQLSYCLNIFGNNPHFFHYFKISTKYVFITGIMIANALAGISGYFFAQTNNFIEMNMGLGKALFCITALILGKAIVHNQNKAYLTPTCGAIVYFSLQQLLLKGGFNLKYFTTIQAILILIILVATHKPKHTKIDLLGV